MSMSELALHPDHSFNRSPERHLISQHFSAVAGFRGLSNRGSAPLTSAFASSPPFQHPPFITPPQNTRNRVYALPRGLSYLAFVLTPVPDQDPQLAARLRKKVFDEIPNRLLEYLILTCDPREYRNKEIAEIMKVEPGTVDGYQKDFAKFGVRSSRRGVRLLWDIRYGAERSGTSALRSGAAAPSLLLTVDTR